MNSFEACRGYMGNPWLVCGSEGKSEGQHRSLQKDTEFAIRSATLSWWFELVSNSLFLWRANGKPQNTSKPPMQPPIGRKLMTGCFVQSQSKTDSKRVILVGTTWFRRSHSKACIAFIGMVVELKVVFLGAAQMVSVALWLAVFQRVCGHLM